MPVIDLMGTKLGICDNRTKTILIKEEEQGLDFSEEESKKLTSLGEICINTAQTLGGEDLRRRMEAIGAINYGTLERPGYDTDAHWFGGILGAFELYGSQLFEGTRIARVVEDGNKVFYCCFDWENPEDPRVLTYVPGSWEDRLLVWENEVNMNLRRKRLIELPPNVRLTG